MSLFARERLVLIKGLSENKDVWDEAAKYAAAISDEVHLVLIDAKPDKRTKAYKILQKAGQIIECKPFGDQELGRAAAWLRQCADEQGVSLTSAAATEVVQRIGTDQYALENELTRLGVLGDITPELVARYTEPAAHDTAYALLELALKGDSRGVQRKVRALSSSEDSYRTVGLLASQVYALAGLVLLDDERVDVAKTLGVHPFVLRNLRSSARQVRREQLARIVARLAAADLQLKSTATEPWLVLEVTLSDVAEIITLK